MTVRRNSLPASCFSWYSWRTADHQPVLSCFAHPRLVEIVSEVLLRKTDGDEL
ncbi:hypothetical protein [Amycolatopsis sp. NPDC058986]|uniref:hypothetical protein n=1 Tax=unclassified Amycolatopsis TaxID=2618356 RepID=UPI00366E0869